MRYYRRHAEPRRARSSRLNSPTTWLAALAGLAVAGAITLAMAPAHAEASSVDVKLTLTGMEDSPTNCIVDTGGTTAYVAPGGKVTLSASLAGASVTIPATLLVPKQVIPLDSSKVASFVMKVTVDGNTHTLNKASDNIVLSNVQGTHNVKWSATGVSLLGGLGYIPLSTGNASLPAGGELDWSGKVIASKDTKCGVEVAVPTVKASAASHTVTLPGVAVTVTNPVPSIVNKVKSNLPKLPNVPGLPTSGSSKGGGKKDDGGKKHDGGGTTKYKPPAQTVPEKVMPHAVNYGGGGGGFAAPVGGAPDNGGGGYAAPAIEPVSTTAAAAPSTEPTIKKAKTVDVAQRSQLGGAQLPVLLAILAIVALATVTGMYANLIRRRI